MVHLIAKYENDLKEALIQAVMAGGDSAARGHDRGDGAWSSPRPGEPPYGVGFGTGGEGENRGLA